MAQIKRAQERARHSDDLAESARELLVEKFARVLEQIAALDPLFRIKVRDYATQQDKQTTNCCNI